MLQVHEKRSKDWSALDAAWPRSSVSWRLAQGKDLSPAVWQHFSPILHVESHLDLDAFLDARHVFAVEPEEAGKENVLDLAKLAVRLHHEPMTTFAPLVSHFHLVGIHFESFDATGGELESLRLGPPGTSSAPYEEEDVLIPSRRSFKAVIKVREVRRGRLLPETDDDMP